MISVLDNIIPRNYQNQILEETKNLPWYFTESTTFGDYDIDKNSAFYHMIFGIDSDPSVNPVMNQKLFNLFLPMIGESFKFLDMYVEEIYRMKLGMYVRNQIDEFDDIHHHPHVDSYDDHQTLLYYVNDTDGPTYIFDENKKILDKIEPKMGRSVILPGNVYHASSPPRDNNMRIVLNVNFGKNIT